MTIYETGDNGLWIFLLLTVLAGRLGGDCDRSFHRVDLAAAVADLRRGLPARLRRALPPLRAVCRAAAFARRIFSSTTRCCCSRPRLGYRRTRTRQMVEQYPWAYESVGPLWWRAKSG